jgi:hypothetical protein
MADSGERTGPQAGFARLGQEIGRVASWIFDHYVAVAGLVAVAATAFYGLAYARFYGELNLTPEQAGMTTTQIVTQSAVGGTVVTALVALAVFCTFLVPVAPVRVDWGAADPGSWLRFLGNVAVTLLGCGFLFGLAAATGVELEPVVGFAITAVLILLVVSFRIRKRGWRFALRPRPLRFSLERYLTAFVAVALPVALLFTGIATYNAARNVGERVAEGEAVEDLEFIGLPFFGTEAKGALIHWEEPGSAPDYMPHCAIYLGGSNGEALFYDRRSRSTFHVPAADITIQVREDLSHCDGPINVRRPVAVRREDGSLVCRRGAWESFLEPRFIYVWVGDGPRGRPVYRTGHATTAALAARLDLRVVRCGVIARSRYGSDEAFSRKLAISPR